jgi:queuine tRNA-ribosyltransferase
MLDGNSTMTLGEFKVHSTAGNARRATLMTAHGSQIENMPVRRNIP